MTSRSTDITGLVLAGGRGSRMGGVDKGLQNLNGRPLVAHVIARLQPQVSQLLINANRSLERYRDFGLPLVSDLATEGVEAYAGPLAGMAAGLAHSSAPWLMAVPCDCPRLPLDLVARLLKAALDQDAEVAVPLSLDADGAQRVEPAFCLMRREVEPALRQFLAAGDRKIQGWLATLKLTQVPFTRSEDALAFKNANTPAELQALETLEENS